MPTVQYRVFVAKSNEIVDGPDDADVVITVPLDEVRDPSFEPTVAYMRGRLKTTGRLGAFFDVLPFRRRGGRLSRLASQPEIAVADQRRTDVVDPGRQGGVEAGRGRRSRRRRTA